MPRARAVALLVPILAAAASACAGSDTQSTVRFAPEFRKAPIHASVFGVYADGRMSPEAWDRFGYRFSTVFADAMCDVGYGEPLENAPSGGLPAIDAAVRQEGVTDELLAKLAPMARGDAIVVFYANTKPQASSDDEPPNSPPHGVRGSGLRRRAPGARPPSGGGDAEPSTLELGASVYSIALRRSVAEVTMTYTGSTEEDAVDRFATKLGELLTGSSCTGWGPTQGEVPARTAEP
jgi:hypothetical protein